MFEALPQAITEAQQLQKDKETGQTSIFSMLDSPEDIPKFEVPDRGEWGTAPKMVHERNALGFCLTGHPLDAFRDVEKKTPHLLAKDIEATETNSKVTLLGNIISARVMLNSRGQEMGIITLQCRDQSIDAMFFGEECQTARRHFYTKSAIALIGKLERRKKDDEEEAKVTIRGEEIIELGEIREKNSTEMIIALQKKDLTEDKLTILKEQLSSMESGKCVLRFQVHYPQQGTAHLNSHFRIKPTEEFLNHLEETFGRANVWSIL